MKFLDKLRGVKSSADYEIALGEVNASIADTKGRLATLKDALRSAPFSSSEEEVRALRQRIRDLEDEIEFAEGVAAETVTRRDQAYQAEITAQVEQRMAGARKDWEQLLKLWEQFDAALDAAEKPLADLKALHEKIGTANQYASEMGRSELALRLPTVEASGRIRQLLNQLSEQSRTTSMRTLVDTERANMPPNVPGFEKGKW